MPCVIVISARFGANDAASDAYVMGSFNETTFVEEPDRQPSDHCPIAVDVRREYFGATQTNLETSVERNILLQ